MSGVRVGIRLSLLTTAALLTACQSIPPTNIVVTGTLEGQGGNPTLSMTHSGGGTGPPHVVISSPTSVRDLRALSLGIVRRGAAPAVGYELLTTFNEQTVSGGGGVVGEAAAGDVNFHRLNTGSLAKVSYDFFEDSGETARFDLPPVQALRTSGTAWLARVPTDRAVKVPFLDATNNRASFLTSGCLTGGTVPCLDMAALVGRLFTELSGQFGTFADTDPNVDLGGPNGDGNFRLDYIPSLRVNAGPCSNPRSVPGFGFVFTGTVVGAGVTAFDVSIPILFGIDSTPIPGGLTEFSAVLAPFDFVGSLCHEAQGIGPIVVRARTPFGLGAGEAAAAVRTTLACTLFGSGLDTIACPAGTPAEGEASSIAVLGVAAMVSNTLNFYHRAVLGGSVSLTADIYLRAINADDVVGTTRLIPATARDCPNGLVTRPEGPMCRVELFALE